MQARWTSIIRVEPQHEHLGSERCKTRAFEIVLAIAVIAHSAESSWANEMLELIGRDGYLYLSKRIVRAWTDHRPDATATSLREHMFPLDILPVLFRGEIRGGGLVLKPEWRV